MAAEQTMSREEKLLEDARRFITNAEAIIFQMLDFNNRLSEQHTSLVDEILQIIFFLGKFQVPKFTPEQIFNDDDIFNDLRRTYPRPFKLYSSQLPRRGPFSCVLDMVVHLIGERNQDQIIAELQNLIRQLVGKPLVSATICVSKTQNSRNYYGVSMSTTGSHPGKIMVAASCLSTYWDSYIAGAVMTYYPKKDPGFDGTIKLPEMVTHQAFSLRNGEPMAPCISCGNLFGLSNRSEKKWAYGHCAEAESLSNLFKSEREVRAQSQPISENFTEEKMNRAVQSVRIELKRILKFESFEWHEHFYTPQQAENILELE